MRLEVQGIVKEYRRRKVVDDVSFYVNQGEIVGLLGPNGAGENHLVLYRGWDGEARCRGGAARW